ncbi:MAG: TVP38/TMEM64 family protein, partial [Firmicutes bacterium]|nr:TVP38/TMEM64 family protein [Bacillota bacterium]
MTFAILAGAIFGPYLGSILCLVATTIGAMGS